MDRIHRDTLRNYFKRARELKDYKEIYNTYCDYIIGYITALYMEKIIDLKTYLLIHPIVTNNYKWR